ncbi:hypothetical protein [Mitsuaria sp. 7]|uniref:hypothetical protein n=1 Tax=Mitsuaria sp. 7 TaxID=1658665 RepID=UPI0007DD4BB8|nr:hypothetical protein [Mitsuaria sp. 7]ANH68303.1 hypothetical protein ABE85_13330 [Mitsuaria sp. 7]
MSIQATNADPLVAQPRADRLAYATGMLLDAQDFSDEQTYHRGRLARALAFVAGPGTLAGLEVRHVPESPTQVEEISVQPGVAVDRLGRLVELPRDACLRLERWFNAVRDTDGGDTLRQASYDDLGRFASQRLIDDGTALPALAVVADVYLRFAACARGLTPSFAQGPFDALNAVSISRLRDAYELLMIPRAGLDDAYSGLPLPPADPVAGDPTATPQARRDALQDAVLHGWAGSGHAGGDGGLEPSPEQPRDLDPSAVFLARVFIPVDNATPPARVVGAPLVDNWGRRFLPPSALFAQWAGL